MKSVPAIKKFFLLTSLSLAVLSIFTFPVIAVFAQCVAPYSESYIDPTTSLPGCRAPSNAGQVGSGTLTTISSVLNRLGNIINLLIPFFIGLAVFFIIYGIFRYIVKSDNEEERGKAGQFILYGIIGVFLMVSIWGIINILVKSFGTNPSSSVVKDIYKELPVTGLDRQPSDLIELIDRANIIGMNAVIPFLISLAVFVVLFGIFNFIRQGANEENRAEARKFIIWGILSIFFMLSIWGLVNILLKSFNLNTEFPAGNIPCLPTIVDGKAVKCTN